jgi:hypothetical protein
VFVGPGGQPVGPAAFCAQSVLRLRARVPKAPSAAWVGIEPAQPGCWGRRCEGTGCRGSEKAHCGTSGNRGSWVPPVTPRSTPSPSAPWRRTTNPTPRTRRRTPTASPRPRTRSAVPRTWAPGRARPRTGTAGVYRARTRSATVTRSGTGGPGGAATPALTATTVAPRPACLHQNQGARSVRRNGRGRHCLGLRRR